MSAKLLEGKPLADRIKTKLKKDVAFLREKTGRVPALVSILIGSDQAACAYAQAQKKTAEAIGISYHLIHLSDRLSTTGLMKEINRLNCDAKVDGIIIQKPLPPRLRHEDIIDCLAPAKDIEGITKENLGKIFYPDDRIVPPTAAAVMEHVRVCGIRLRGKEVVIVGHSEIVGKPLALLFLNHLATVTVCHIGTSEAGKLAAHVKRADILVVAVGRARLIRGSWIKKGAVVIDVGINKVGGKIVGDVEFNKACLRASFITPVPGGVGPVTAVMLMKNALMAFRRKYS